MERSISFFLFGEYCEMSKSATLQITDTVAIVIVHKRINIRDSCYSHYSSFPQLIYQSELHRSPEKSKRLQLM
jgi:hypothetical protein